MRARREVMDAGPSGSCSGRCAVIVTTGVVHVPAQIAGIEFLLFHPVNDGDAVERGNLRMMSAFNAALGGNRECARRAELIEQIVEAFELFAVTLIESDGRLNAIL